MKGKHLLENEKGWEAVNLKVINVQGTLCACVHVNVCACTHVCVYLWFCSTSFFFFEKPFFFFLSFRTQKQEGHTQQLRKQETSTLKLKNKNMKTESIFCIFLCSLFPLNFPENIHTLSVHDWEWRCLDLFVHWIRCDLSSFISANLLIALENISSLDHISEALGAESRGAAVGQLQE